jgi:hypothetical protein
LLALASPFSTSVALPLAGSLATEILSTFKNKIRHPSSLVNKIWKVPFAFLLLALGVLAMRRPISGLEYNNLRKENRGNILRGRDGAPLQPPAPLSFSLNIFFKKSDEYYTVLQDHTLLSSKIQKNRVCNQKEDFCQRVFHQENFHGKIIPRNIL